MIRSQNKPREYNRLSTKVLSTTILCLVYSHYRSSSLNPHLEVELRSQGMANGYWPFYIYLGTYTAPLGEGVLSLLPCSYCSVIR